MVSILEVKTKKQQKEFLTFPLKMYKDNPYFCPPIFSSEKRIFDKDYEYYKSCEAVYYNAYRDNVMVGRISGIIQKSCNEKNNEKRARFTRFDAVNDEEVASALFAAVEKWAKDKGMNTVCGPLGFSDIERGCLRIEGFDQISTTSEQYNFKYYKDLIEGCGYEKEVDWIERKIKLPKDGGEKIVKVANSIANRYHLKVEKIPKRKKELKIFIKDFLKIVDEVFYDAYQTIDMNNKYMQKLVYDEYKMIFKIISSKYCGLIVDENNNTVGFGVAMPCFTKALQKSGGHLTLPTIFRILKIARRPEIVEFLLIGVKKEYKGAGILLLSNIIDIFKSYPCIKHAETNFCMEGNKSIQLLWDKRFNSEIHKRCRSYVKKLK